MKKVGLQGNHGTFSEIAVVKYFENEEIEEIAYRNFVEIMEDLENHVIDYAVLPVENTTTGIIARTYDLFQYYHIHAIAEVLVPIREDLIVYPGTRLEDIREVYSHPEALSQCQQFFDQNPQIKAVPYQDTAKSVELVKESKDTTKAALGSYLAAKYYGLESLLESVQDSKTNMTRFLVMTWKNEESKSPNKTSLMLKCNHEPGSLYRVLGILADNRINMVKLESRPVPGRVFEYQFYIDIEGSQDDVVISNCLQEMRKHCIELRSFGSYEAAKVEF